MRTHGTLTKWNDDRGFGFIAPAQGNEELFVHVSAFPRDGIRPRINELISFDVEQAGDGKRRAVRVMRPGGINNPGRSDRQDSPRSPRSAMSALFALLAVGAIGAYYYSRLDSRPAAATTRPLESSAQISPSIPVQTSACDGRTQCSQMTSCAEARYFLQHCPNTRMDGNHDGEPCEQQWCN